ncbi:MAG: hypothetical protein KGI37_10420 [Alphaproteobacteria bacterium]|nr:hypothetical protein [Alphaproteobacteria bacterium]
MTTNATTGKLTEQQEEQMVHLVRNALLVAGQEMDGDGHKGDQWPVIKSTIHAIMKDWEDLKIERNVDAELKVHLYEQIKEMEAGFPDCTPAARAVLEPKIKELREICDAYFADLNKDAVFYDEEAAPEHVKRMKAIVSTLEGEND